MADLIDRQAATDALIAQANSDEAYGYVDGYTIGLTLATLPSEDAVEVVRCKDCRNYVCDGVMVCIRFEDASLKPDDYCSYGERKDG